jgi:lanosterol synthase
MLTLLAIGPLFLIPGLVIALHVCGQALRPEQAVEMRRYLLAKRRKEGGWGLYVSPIPSSSHHDTTHHITSHHITSHHTRTSVTLLTRLLEFSRRCSSRLTLPCSHTAAPPTVYGTVMNYVSLRLLGMGPDEGPMTEIRALIHKMGGATRIPSWGKAWLSILGAYDWDGMNPVPTELW